MPYTCGFNAFSKVAANESQTNQCSMPYNEKRNQQSSRASAADVNLAYIIVRTTLADTFNSEIKTLPCFSLVFRVSFLSTVYCAIILLAECKTPNSPL